MNRKLYVGNLNFEANEEQVRELFSNYGEVADVKVIMDRFSGRSRGFAFVTMDSAESATKAKEALSGQEFQGKALVVDIARSEDRPAGERRPHSGGGEFRGGPRRERSGGDWGNRSGNGGDRPRRDFRRDSRSSY